MTLVLSLPAASCTCVHVNKRLILSPVTSPYMINKFALKQCQHRYLARFQTHSAMLILLKVLLMNIANKCNRLLYKVSASLCLYPLILSNDLTDHVQIWHAYTPYVNRCGIGLDLKQFAPCVCIARKGGFIGATLRLMYLASLYAVLEEVLLVQGVVTIVRDSIVRLFTKLNENCRLCECCI